MNQLARCMLNSGAKNALTKQMSKIRNFGTFWRCMSRTRCALGNLIVTVLIIVGCSKASLAIAKPLEADFPTMMKILAKNKKEMTHAAYEVWYQENIVGRRTEFELLKPLPIEVERCYGCKSADYKITVQLVQKGYGFFSCLLAMEKCDVVESCLE